MGICKSQVTAIVEQLQEFKKNFYNLTPVEVGQFINLKTSMINKGIILTDTKLEMEKDDLIDYIMTSLLVDQGPENLINTTVEEMFQANVDKIEDDRVQIRNQIFNNEMRVTITQGGRVFATQWNSKMNLCTVSIPSTWNVAINQATLLDLYQKQFQKAPEVGTNDKEVSKFNTYIFDLLSRHTDYGVIRKLVEIEFESHSIYKDSVNKKIFTKLKDKGFSEITAYILSSFVEHINAQNTTYQTIKSMLGFRKRLINELEKIVS